VLFRRRRFIETGTKQSFTGRLGREELQQWRNMWKNNVFFEPLKHENLFCYSLKIKSRLCKRA